MRLASLALTVTAALVVAGCSAEGGKEAAAENYPTNCDNIELLVGFSPGGSTDLAFRVLAEELKESLDTDIQVVNVDGGGGMQMINQLRSAPADGCTLGHTTIPTHLQYLYPEFEGQYAKEDFAFAGAFAQGPQVLTVAADSPYQTLDDLVEAGREKVLISAADAPKGGNAILNAQFAEAAGVDVTQVVVDGGAEKVTALLSGQADFQNGALGSALPSIESGQLRALALFSPERNDTIPDVPTAQEEGIDVVGESVYGLMMSSDTPEPVRQELEESLQEITGDEEFRDEMMNLGLPTQFQTGVEFSRTWDEMIDDVESVDFSSLN